MRDAVNKAARLVINHCLKHGICLMIFGWNKRQKDSINIGAKNNQKFVQIPTAKLKERIIQLCELYGIEFIKTEESYTLQASFLDDDLLPNYGEKPGSWKPSGKRIKRCSAAKGGFPHERLHQDNEDSIKLKTVC
ncbi:IS200/IS605 family accessory protein TnpB-related protein [Okeania sp. SIO2C9]|uniref:IS200/IS605 family accessory protein TnpB-related protein n=1 Tax=Okeania sp. SIO2C9 TaxID=2607791 RepID=UPI0025F12A4F|nr:IS200/IS605 family accessory protein TnpB-related protein [Okeania sp. SIO2C9]